MKEKVSNELAIAMYIPAADRYVHKFTCFGYLNIFLLYK